MLGNPLRYTDPTGHYCVGDDEDCADEAGQGPALTGTGNNNAGGGGGNPHDDDDLDPNPDGVGHDPGTAITRDELIQVQNNAENLASYYQNASTWWAWAVGAGVGVGTLAISCTTVVYCGLGVASSLVFAPAAGSLAGQLGGGMQAEAASSLAESIENVLIKDSSESFTVWMDQETNSGGAIMLPGGIPVGTIVQKSTVKIIGSSGYVTVITHYDVSFRVLAQPSSVVTSSFGGLLP